MKKSNISGLTDEKFIKKFDCGNDLLNNYLYDESIHDESNNTHSTTVFYNDDKIIGYYTVSASIIVMETGYDRTNFNKEHQLPEDNNQRINLPAIELSWFAVDREFQGNYVGTAMMRQLFSDIIQVRHIFNIGLIGVCVASLPNAVEFYNRFNFEYLHYDYDNTPLYPPTYPLYLSLQKISEMMGYLN